MAIDTYAKRGLRQSRQEPQGQGGRFYPGDRGRKQGSPRLANMAASDRMTNDRMTRVAEVSCRGGTSQAREHPDLRVDEAIPQNSGYRPIAAWDRGGQFPDKPT